MRLSHTQRLRRLSKQETKQKAESERFEAACNASPVWIVWTVYIGGTRRKGKLSLSDLSLGFLAKLCENPLRYEN